MTVDTEFSLGLSDHQAEKESVIISPGWSEFVGKLPEDAKEEFARFVQANNLKQVIEKLIKEKEKETETNTDGSDFFKELEKEYRDENYCPTSEEIRAMDKEKLMIMTKNAVYILMIDLLNLRNRLRQGKTKPEEVIGIIDKLWEQRNANPEEVELIEGGRFEDARNVLAKKKRGPFDEKEWQEFQRLKKVNGRDQRKKPLEREVRKYKEMYMRYVAWERSSEFRNLEQEKQEAEKVLGRYDEVNKERFQRDLQISLSQELSSLTGKEAAEVFEDVLMSWILNSQSRSSIGDEEMMLECAEVVENWKRKHQNDEPVSEVNPVTMKKAEKLTDHFWDFYVNICFDDGWKNEPENMRKSKISQFLVATKKMAETRSQAKM